MKRGSVELSARQYETDATFDLRDNEAGLGLVVSAETLRWICLTAGPALLAEHAPLPAHGLAQLANHPLTTPFDKPEPPHPGQLEIDPDPG